jgi:hypothetical protein
MRFHSISYAKHNGLGDKKGDMAETLEKTKQLRVITEIDNVAGRRASRIEMLTTSTLCRLNSMDCRSHATPKERMEIIRDSP